MVMTKLLEKKLVKMYRLLIIFFCLLMFFQPSNILIFWTITHYFLMSIADLVCICIHMSTKNTTTQDIGQGSNPIHIKWNAAKQNEFVESIFNNETAFQMYKKFKE